MLKFFRKYNKLILVIGASLLMIAFLIQPVLTIFFPDPRKQPFAEIAGEEVTVADRAAADLELRVLGELNLETQFPPALRQRLEDEGVRFPLPEDELVWMMIVRDAKKIGLSAGPQSVGAVYQALGVTPEVMDRLIENFRVTQGFIDQAVRNWIIAHQYLALASGSTYEQNLYGDSSPLEAIRMLERFEGAMRVLPEISYLARIPGMREQFNGAVSRIMEPVGGRQRLSSPLIQQSIQRLEAGLDVDYAVLPATLYSEEVEAPADAKLQELFEQYKNDPDGTSKPFGFGYQQPARVKFEYLTLPHDRVQELVEQEITQADVQEYYLSNPQRYELVLSDLKEQAATQPAATQGKQPALPRKAREEIKQDLVAERATVKARQIMTYAQSELFARDVRPSPSNLDGERDVSQLTPTPLAELATLIEERFEVKPVVNDLTQEFTAVDELFDVPGIGFSSVDGVANLRFNDLVASMRELNPNDEPVAINRRAQLKLPSPTLSDQQGSFYLFRVIEAEAPKAPPSLDEVREAVESDARLLAAYERLQSERDQWVKLAVEKGIDQVTIDAGGQSGRYSADDLKLVDRNAGRAAAPMLPGLGRPRAVVDELFAKAEELGAKAVSQADEQKKTLAIDVPSELSVVVFKLKSFRPITREQFEMVADQPMWLYQTNSLVNPDGPNNPVTVEDLRKRTSFVDLEETDEGS